MRLKFWLLALLLFSLVSLLTLHNLLPNNYHPFAPLELTEKPTFVTKFKITRLKSKPQACLEVLSKSELDFATIKDRETGESCGFENAVQLRQSSVSYGGNIQLSCPALVALTMWETHDLNRLAQKHLNKDITKVLHYGTYACRNINGASSGRRSEHAYANAIDIAGFVLEGNRQVSVLNHWESDSNEGEFIRAVHHSACDYFKTVLGPEYNSLHKDHFHFDMGSSFACK